MENRFNLIDEPWIPIADAGLVGLKEVFANNDLKQLGGNPVQKISLMKLLLAIGQAALTPNDEASWRQTRKDEFLTSCEQYLQQWHSSFYLYGDNPFLQMPAIKPLIEDSPSICGTKSLGSAFYPDVWAENNTVLSQGLVPREIDDADRALYLLTLMNFAFAGKRVAKGLTTLGGRQLGNRYSAPAGPSLGGSKGYLHSYVLTGSLQEDIWYNLLTDSDIESLKRWPGGMGKPIWQKMPESETDQVSSSYITSHQACLVALSRFALLASEGIYYMDGINYPKISEGWFEPTLVLDHSKKDIKAKYVNLDKKPWRELDSLLAFIDSDVSSGFECFALRKVIPRLRQDNKKFAVWCGGLSVNNNSGDQSVKKDDDFVESTVWLESSILGAAWFMQLKNEIDDLNSLAKILYSSVRRYFEEQSLKATDSSGKATNIFWQLTEKSFQELVDNCDQAPECDSKRRELRKRFVGHVFKVFDSICPKRTSRQLDAWAKCRPNVGKYLS